MSAWPIPLFALVSSSVAVMILLRAPSDAWWRNPAALAVLAGTVVALTALVTPRDK